MKKEKHRKSGLLLGSFGRITKKQTALLCIFLIIVLAVGGTLSYMLFKSEQLDNQFTPAEVACQVNVDGGSFDVTNKGTIDAYIRAAIVVNWMDDEGKVSGIAPVEGEDGDYTIAVNSKDWWKDSNTGYYYYKSRVNPLDVTKDLITSYGLVAGAETPTGYELCVEVVAEAIQADGTTDTGDVPAYKDAWEINDISGN